MQLKRLTLSASAYTTFAATTLLLSGLSHAQSAGLEEIIVVAQKRAESIQEVPISIVSFDQDKLSDLGIADLTDISSSIPGLYVNPFNADPGAVRLFIRGIGGNSVQITQDPSVALYLDGVYIGSAFGTGFEGVDIERIEVLRGPQGTLYGRNSTGGAVNILTARASTDAFRFRQELTAGNLGAFKSRSMVNIPVTDSLAVKLNYLLSQRDGYVRNHGPGADFGEEDRESLVADIHWDIADNFSLDYRYESTDMNDSQRLEQVTKVDPTAALAFSTTIREFDKDRLDSVTSFRYIPRNSLDLSAHTLHLGWTVSESLDIRSITAYRSFDSVANSDALSTAEGNGIFYSGSPTTLRILTDFEQFSQEFQFLGNTRHLEYVAGLYYFTSEADWANDRQLSLGNTLSVNESTAKNTSYAIFGQATYTPDAFGQKLHLTLGARYSDEDREVKRTNLNIAPQIIGGKYDKSFSNFNPSFTIAYDLADDISVYGKIMTGFKSGGTSMNSANIVLFAEGFEEEDVISYEIGYKSILADNRVRFNAAAFWTEMDGAQTSVQTGASPNARDFLPLDDNIFKGVEFDLEAQLTDSLRLGLSYSYLSTKAGADYIDSAVGRTFLIDEFPSAPRHSVAASLNHDIDLPNGRLSSALNYSFQDEVQSSINLTDNTTLPSYSLLSASVTWKEIRLSGVDGEFSIQLWGRNLLDEEYAVVSTASWASFGAAEVTTFGDPRTYGVTLGYSY